jgi:hypothetical protein
LYAVRLQEELKLFTGSYVADRHSDLWAALTSIDGADPSADERVTTELLAPVVAAASDTKLTVARPAHYVLWVLTNYFSAARQCVARMVQDPRSHARVWAVLSVGNRAPRPFQLEILRHGLSDRGEQVRRHAACRALSYHLQELLPDMEAAAVRVRNAAVRQEIENCHRLLRDGYFVTPAKGDRVALTVALDGGGVKSRLVSRVELETRGIESLVSELKARRN